MVVSHSLFVSKRQWDMDNTKKGLKLITRWFTNLSEIDTTKMKW